jgi:hypothetical protein
MRRSLIVAAALSLSAPAAIACTNQAEVMAHFENVKNAYLEAAPNLKPEQFPIWAGHLEVFGNEMSTLDFAGACGALDAAAVELGFNVALAGTNGNGEVGPPAPKADGTGTVTIGSGVSVGSGVAIGSGGSGSDSQAPGGSGGTQANSAAVGTPSTIRVRTRPRPRR